MELKKNKYSDALLLAIGELIIAVLIILIYILVGHFKWQVISGTILGGLVTIINFLILSHAVNKALDQFIDLRGNKEMSEEEAEQFSKQHAIKVQNAVTKSYVLRTGLMFGSLVLAFISGWFDPISTLVPLMMYKPLIYVINFVKQKRGE